MFTITVASIDRKPKRSAIVTVEGRRHFCWTNKLDDLGIEPGATYNVDTEEFQGKDGPLVNIASAKRVTVCAPEPREPFKSGAYRRPEPPSPAASAASGAPFRTPEQLFVQGVVEHYIANGRCEPGKLTEIMRFVLNAYRATWPDAEHYSIAAE